MYLSNRNLDTGSVEKNITLDKSLVHCRWHFQRLGEEAAQRTEEPVYSSTMLVLVTTM
uniref:Uncharacterized protein n=1 Tax=Octopus bimaculoides TaxID=37653 RepID=A0A0L8G9E0_OCTBM